MNLVILTGKLTRDPELRSLPSGKQVATFAVATEFSAGRAHSRIEYTPIVAWGPIASAVGEFLNKGDLVNLHGRLQTRQWDDDTGRRHWKTEVVAADIRLLKNSPRAKNLLDKLGATRNPDENGLIFNEEVGLVAM